MAVAEKLFKNRLNKIPHTIRVALTFTLVNVFWVLFRAENFEKAINLYKGMANFGNIGLFDLKDIAFDGLLNFPTIIDIAYIITVLVILLIVVFKTKASYVMLEEYKPTYRNVLTALVLFCVSLIFISRESIFIYFNF